MKPRCRELRFLALAPLLFCSCEPPQPVDVQDHWQTFEVARFGGAEEGLASLNVVNDVQFAYDSSVWILDWQTQSIVRFDPTDSSASLVARRGQGPGEMELANGIRRAPNGEMWVRDFGNHRIVSFESDGTLITQHWLPPHSYGFRWEAAVDTVGRITDRLQAPDADTSRQFLVSFEFDGSAADTNDFPTKCAEEPLPPLLNLAGGAEDFVDLPFRPEILSHITSSGSIWCGRTDRYDFRRFEIGGTEINAFVRGDSSTVSLSRLARDSAIADVEAELSRASGPAARTFDHSLIPHVRPALRSLATDDEHRLWVLRDRADGSVGFDVWSNTGQRIATVDLPHPIRISNHFRVYKGQLALLVLDADGIPSVALFRWR